MNDNWWSGLWVTEGDTGEHRAVFTYEEASHYAAQLKDGAVDIIESGPGSYWVRFR